MARDEAYRKAEQKIEAARRSRATKLDLYSMGLSELPESLGQLMQLQSLDLHSNQLTVLPESLGQLTQLQSLDLSHNQLTALPEWMGQLTQLQSLDLSHNQLAALPEWLGWLTQLQSLDLYGNQLTALPESMERLTQLHTLNIGHIPLKGFPKDLGRLTQLQKLVLSDYPLGTLPECLSQLRQLRGLYLNTNNLYELPEWLGQFEQLQNLQLVNNALVDLPPSLVQLKQLGELRLNDNPLNPELAAAYKQGIDAVKAYLRAKAEAPITLHEAKLILVGEGEVGKSCLLGALRGDPWEEGRPTTHGIEIKPVIVASPDGKTEITLNGWDFGGQRVYRPTHQLFFSAPAVYLVVWKPREGPQQGFVREWIQLIVRREPTAKILVVATHGGPQQRQPDIDRQELWDLFGRDTVLDFFFVESKPDAQGVRRGVEELKCAIAAVAASLPEVGRSVPKSFQETWQALQEAGAAYLPLERVLAICREHKMDDELARLFVTISHKLGHLIHYEHDPALRDIVVLKPDWLATAISFVLDDEVTRSAHGLVRLSRLGRLWDDPTRPAETRYPADLHPIFLRLMERFDLSYRVTDPTARNDTDPLSLIAQLVPDMRPGNLDAAWLPAPTTGDLQQTQICRIVDAQNGGSAAAEGLFFQMIVRLHKYSLGRADYNDSVHWQRGLVLDHAYNGRALLEHRGNDVHITVRAPYPERFLAMLTEEAKYLVESFWEGLRCSVMVPCIEPCGANKPGSGLYDVKSLIESKKEGFPKFPCPTCNRWQDINCLLRNAPAATQPFSADALLAELATIKGQLDRVDANTSRVLSRIDEKYAEFLKVYTDEAKEGPRLFSLVPVDRSGFDPRRWVRASFRLILWCEHSHLPLPMLNADKGEREKKKGVYEIELDREWFKRAAPFLKVATGTLSLILPVAASGIKLALDEAAYKAIEEQLDFGKNVIDAALGEGGKIGGRLDGGKRIRPAGAGGGDPRRGCDPARDPGDSPGQGPRLRRPGARDEQAPGVPVGASAVREGILK